MLFWLSFFSSHFRVFVIKQSKTARYLVVLGSTCIINARSALFITFGMMWQRGSKRTINHKNWTRAHNGCTDSLAIDKLLSRELDKSVNGSADVVNLRLECRAACSWLMPSAQRLWADWASACVRTGRQQSIYRFAVNVLVFYCVTCWNTSLVFSTPEVLIESIHREAKEKQLLLKCLLTSKLFILKVAMSDQ